MPHVSGSGRAGTVFISYARADDQKPPYEDTAQGWVRFFWDQLRWELTDRGAKQARLWLDRYEIEPAEAFTQKIEGAVREAALILPVFSQNWVQSDWCKREVEVFTRVHPDATSRVVPVFKNELLRDQLPQVLLGDNAREGYRFFTRDEHGAVHEFYWRGLQDRKAYFDLLRRIATYIIECLDIQIAPPKERRRQREASPARRVIFLAVADQELRDARQRLANDLRAADMVVIPETNELPDTAADCEQLLREQLTRAELSVHFLGENPDISPTGGSESIIDLQLRLAREAAATRRLPRILWAPRWVPALHGEKRDPLEVVRRSGGLRAGEEVYGEEVTDLSQWLRSRFLPTRDEEILVVAASIDGDDDLVASLANLSQGLGLKVSVVFHGDPMPAVGPDSTVLVPWDQADRATLEALLARIPAGAHTICLRLPGGDEAAKRRFFRNGVFLEQVDMLPKDRQGTRALLEKIEVLAPEGPTQ